MTIMLLIKSNPYISKQFHDVQNKPAHFFSLKTGKKLVFPFNKCKYWYSEIK